MDLFNRQAKAQVQELRRQTQELCRQRDLLEKQVERHREVQEIIVKDILTFQDTQAAYVGNDYRDYATAVQAISDKFNCKAEWGCLHTGIVISLRAAFILGEGIKVRHLTEPAAEAKIELDWTKDFLAYNALDGEMTQEIAKEAEIEGKCALRLAWDVDPYKAHPGMVTVRFVSWSAKKYQVEADPADYLWYKKLSWKATGKEAAGEIEEPCFVYKKFGGRLNMPNEAQPAIQGCLTQIDRLDRALRDLREIDHLFASATPYFKVTNQNEIQSLTEKLAKINWKIGKLLVSTADFSMVGTDPEGAETLLKEIEILAKMISGRTGIPIHYLGFLDLLKNRATGDNTRELVMAATTRERMIWRGAFNELVEKAMGLYNEKVNAQKAAKLDPSKIQIDIPLITQEHWDRIERVMIPAATHGIVSKEFVAGQIPGVDQDKEAELREKRDQAEAERGEKELEALTARIKGQDQGQDQNQGRPGEGDE